MILWLLINPSMDFFTIFSKHVIMLIDTYISVIPFSYFYSLLSNGGLRMPRVPISAEQENSTK